MRPIVSSNLLLQIREYIIGYIYKTVYVCLVQTNSLTKSRFPCLRSLPVRNLSKSVENIFIFQFNFSMRLNLYRRELNILWRCQLLSEDSIPTAFQQCGFAFISFAFVSTHSDVRVFLDCFPLCNQRFSWCCVTPIFWNFAIENCPI